MGLFMSFFVRFFGFEKKNRIKNEKKRKKPVEKQKITAKKVIMKLKTTDNPPTTPRPMLRGEEQVNDTSKCVNLTC